MDIPKSDINYYVPNMNVLRLDLPGIKWIDEKYFRKTIYDMIESIDDEIVERTNGEYKSNTKAEVNLTFIPGSTYSIATAHIWVDSLPLHNVLLGYLPNGRLKVRLVEHNPITDEEYERLYEEDPDAIWDMDDTELVVEPFVELPSFKAYKTSSDTVEKGVKATNDTVKLMGTPHWVKPSITNALVIEPDNDFVYRNTLYANKKFREDSKGERIYPHIEEEEVYKYLEKAIPREYFTVSTMGTGVVIHFLRSDYAPLVLKVFEHVPVVDIDGNRQILRFSLKRRREIIEEPTVTKSSTTSKRGGSTSSRGRGGNTSSRGGASTPSRGRGGTKPTRGKRF